MRQCLVVGKRLLARSPLPSPHFTLHCGNPWPGEDPDTDCIGASASCHRRFAVVASRNAPDSNLRTPPLPGGCGCRLVRCAWICLPPPSPFSSSSWAGPCPSPLPREGQACPGKRGGQEWIVPALTARWPA